MAEKLNRYLFIFKDYSEPTPTGILSEQRTIIEEKELKQATIIFSERFPGHLIWIVEVIDLGEVLDG